MESRTPVTLRELLRRHEMIEVPIIQRDYAQGRRSAYEVRESFLGALEDALLRATNDMSLPLNLDFIYGSLDGNSDTRFTPLDGQQRLTTLFLLHWYLAWCDDAWEAFGDLAIHEGSSRFRYGVRPSSEEFFDELVVFRPRARPRDTSSVASLIVDQPWYRRNWRLDPTIQSVLTMLDAMHKRLADAYGLYARLTDEDNPAITFHLLDLRDFGLSDDLYIKMNSRGRPLTEFETFKARYEQVLRQQDDGEEFEIAGQPLPVSEYVSRKLDTTWADLFWHLRDPKSALFDGSIMSILRVIALATLRPADEAALLDDLKALRDPDRPPTFTDFHKRRWLDRRFTRTVIRLFDAWSARDGHLVPLLPNNAYFDETEFYQEAAKRGANLPYTALIQFIAYASYVREHKGTYDPQKLQAWMRIASNLAINTEHNRPDDFRRSFLGIVELLPYADDILTHVASTARATRGFSDVQLAEEKLKAELMLANGRWKPLIEQAEAHPYLRGQIGFLLDFSGAQEQRRDASPQEWTVVIHEQIQTAFERYIALATKMFDQKGLRDLGRYRWQRALLTLGDYMLPSGRNVSFLKDSATEQASWKRLLRGTDHAARARPLLKRLWDQIDGDKDIAEQLDALIDASEVAEPWRRTLVDCPTAFCFCENQALRWHDDKIYLLKRSQLNGAHVELFSFCLHQKLLQLGPHFNELNVDGYESVNDTYSEPHLAMSRMGQGQQLELRVYSTRSNYLLELVLRTEVAVQGLTDELERLQYETDGQCFTRLVQHSDVLPQLAALDSLLSRWRDEARSHG